MSTKEDDLKIARALGMYARITSRNRQTIPDALGDRYRGDIEGRRAFREGWYEANVYISIKALDLVLMELDRARA